MMKSRKAASPEVGEQQQAKRRKIGQQAEAINNDLDPMSKPRSDTRPRHQAKDCPGRGKRQPHGVKMCGFCGKELKSKPKAKTSSAQVTVINRTDT
mgnify:CR=1 FL=1